MGLNASLFTAGRSLQLFSTGIQVAGQNVSNASTPGYVREELQFRTDAPYESGGLLVGTGARSGGIRQQLNYHLEQQIHLANADMGGATARADAFSQLEIALAELGSGDLSTKLGEFTSAIENLVNQPELSENRQFVVQEGVQLSRTIQAMRQQVDRNRQGLTQEVNGLVDEANELIDQVAKLNKQITNMESGGLIESQAGGLRTERLRALNRLSEIVPIETTALDNGMINVFSGTEYLVLNGNPQHLQTEAVGDRGLLTNQVSFAKTGSVFTSSNGELGGTIDARDNILGGFVDELDKYARAVIQEVNKIHASGEGLKGYESLTATNGIDDSSAVLNQAGLALRPQHGSFVVKIHDQAQQTTESTLVEIDLDGLNGDDTTLQDLQAAFDGIDHLSAGINNQGELTLNTADGYEVRFAEDSSNILAALGINTFFRGSDSGNIAVNETLRQDASLLAAGQGGGPGDNRNAIVMAKFSEQPSSVLGETSLDDFYSNLTSQIATSSSAESSMNEGFKSFHSSLESQRTQFSAVSLDEEAIKIMNYQQGYAAAARIVSTVDELFNILLGL